MKWANFDINSVVLPTHSVSTLRPPSFVVLLFLLFQGRFDALVCPPQQPEGSSSVWTRAVVHDRESLVITLPFSSFLTCIPSFQVHGTAALEQIRRILTKVHDAQKAGHNTADKPAEDAPGGDDGEDDKGPGGHGDYDSNRIAISEWRGIITDDVSWQIGRCYSFP